MLGALNGSPSAGGSAPSAMLGSAGSVAPGAGQAAPGSSPFGPAAVGLSPAAGTPLLGGASSPPGLPTPGASGLPGQTPVPGPGSHHFPGGLLIADQGNGRILAVNDAGQILWQFPGPGTTLPPNEKFAADDAFLSPDGRSIVANEEFHDVVVRIDIASRQIVWEYGMYDRPGSAAGRLNTPDDAYPLANGDITVADIKNCRVIELSPARQIVRQWGTTGICVDGAPATYGSPNGDTPLPDGGMLITEIYGSRVVRLSAAGRVIFDIHVPVSYPSDAQLLADGNVSVVDYASHGALVVVNPTTGQVVYRYNPTSGPGRLNHPSLALPLPDGTFVLNDDDRARVIVIDPATSTIVWSYGHTNQPSAAPGFLNDPDGVDPLPVGIFT